MMGGQATYAPSMDRELETFARALGRTRAELEEQIEGSPHPKAERQRIERSADRVKARVEKAEEDRELDQFAGENWERHEQLRTLTDAEMQQARNSQSLGRQLDQALTDASLLMETAASEVGGTGHNGKLESKDPGRISGALYTHGRLDVASTYRLVLERMIANLQREIDGARRGSLVDLRKLETSKEKDTRLIRDWEGIRSEIVSVLDPTLGSPRSIEIMRKRNDRRPIDGTPLERAKAA